MGHSATLDNTMKKFTYGFWNDSFGSEIYDDILTKTGFIRKQHNQDILILFSYTDHLKVVNDIIKRENKPKVVIFDRSFGSSIEETTRIDYLLSKAGIKPLVCNLPFISFKSRVVLNTISKNDNYSEAHVNNYGSVLNTIEIIDSITNYDKINLFTKKKIDLSKKITDSDFWADFDCYIMFLLDGCEVASINISKLYYDSSIELTSKNNKLFYNLSNKTFYSALGDSRETLSCLSESLVYFYSSVYNYLNSSNKPRFNLDRMHCTSKYALRTHNIVDKMLLDTVIKQRIEAEQ